jgi:hypothetical protein
MGGHMYALYLWHIAQLFQWVDTCRYYVYLRHIAQL